MKENNKRRTVNWYVIPPAILQFLITSVTRSLFFVFARWKVVGLKENVLSLKRPVIFAANHHSEIDVFLVPAALLFHFRHWPVFFITGGGKEFYNNFGWRNLIYGGLLFKALGAYPTFKGQKNYERSLLNHFQIVEDGYSIYIFPEGKRNGEVETENVRGGSAYLAYRFNIPVIPVAISGTYHTKPRQFFTFRRRIKLEFGRPIYPEEILPRSPQVTEDRNDFREAVKIIMSQIKEIKKDVF